jgi:hypothetical protein
MVLSTMRAGTDPHPSPEILQGATNSPLEQDSAPPGLDVASPPRPLRGQDDIRGGHDLASPPNAVLFSLPQVAHETPPAGPEEKKDIPDASPPQRVESGVIPYDGWIQMLYCFRAGLFGAPLVVAIAVSNFWMTALNGEQRKDQRWYLFAVFIGLYILLFMWRILVLCPFVRNKRSHGGEGYPLIYTPEELSGRGITTSILKAIPGVNIREDEDEEGEGLKRHFTFIGLASLLLSNANIGLVVIDVAIGSEGDLIAGASEPSIFGAALIKTAIGTVMGALLLNDCWNRETRKARRQREASQGPSGLERAGISGHPPPRPISLAAISSSQHSNGLLPPTQHPTPQSSETLNRVAEP